MGCRSAQCDPAGADDATLAPAWLDSLHVAQDSSRTTFSLITCNPNRRTTRPGQEIATIRAANPDIVAIQELNPLVAAALARFVRRHNGLVIVAGDFTMTPLHRFYQTVRASGLSDACAMCGKGPGFTWPGDRRRIFTSPEIQYIDAAIGSRDGFSDHRPAPATLVIPGAGQEE